MKFTITHARDVIGHQIKVLVVAEAGETIASVRTEMDGFQLGHDFLAPPENQYSRTFPQSGGFTPGLDHIVKVTAATPDSKSQIASERWKD